MTTNSDHSLLEHDLRRPLAVHAVAAVGLLHHGAHGLPGRVKGVHLVQQLLWHLLPDWLVVPLQVQDQSQQATLRLVAHLLWKTPLYVWRLWEEGVGEGER